MFARHVVVRLKAKAAPEFTRLIETAVIPMLRKQKGFLDEIVFIAPDLTEAVANSFWETQADAEAYSRKGYAEVIRSLETVVAGTPTVGTAHVSNSTFHKIACGNAA
jgi:Antibiotic biosynthesis monooxygenase